LNRNVPNLTNKPCQQDCCRTGFSRSGVFWVCTHKWSIGISDLSSMEKVKGVWGICMET
jgi:hypothetical protein